MDALGNWLAFLFVAAILFGFLKAYADQLDSDRDKYEREWRKNQGKH